MRAAVIDEQPAAMVRGTFSHPIRFLRGQQLGGRARNGPEQVIEAGPRRGPCPTEPVAHRLDAQMTEGHGEKTIQLFQIVVVGTPTPGQLGEDPVQNLTERDRAPKSLARGTRAAFGLPGEPVTLFLIQDSSLRSPAQQIREISKVFLVVSRPVSNGIREVEA